MVLPLNAATPGQNTDPYNCDSATSFLSPVLLSIWNRANLDSSRHMTISHCFGAPFPFSLIDQWVFSGLHSHLVPGPLGFLLGRACGNAPLTSSGVAGFHLLPAETRLSLPLLSNGSLCFYEPGKIQVMTCFSLFLSPKDVAETSEF